MSRMRFAFICGALLCASTLSACSLFSDKGAPVGATQNVEQSPREEAEGVLNEYASILALADTAVSSDALADKPDILQKIGVASSAATKAVKAYSAEALKCWRDQSTGVVGDAPGLPPGQHCDTSQTKRLLSSAKGLVSEAKGVLAAFGFKLGG